MIASSAGRSRSFPRIYMKVFFMKKMNPFRQAARNAALARFPVFPLRPHEKIPAIKGWQQAATTDVAAIDRPSMICLATCFARPARQFSIGSPASGSFDPAAGQS
jgi:hypothetical protein